MREIKRTFKSWYRRRFRPLGPISLPIVSDPTLYFALQGIKPTSEQFCDIRNRRAKAWLDLWLDAKI